MSDFSSYVTIDVAATGPILNLSQSQANSGSFSDAPPQKIMPGTTAQFRLEDPSGPRGSSGYVTYEAEGFYLTISFDCPYGMQMNMGAVAISGGDFALDWFGQTVNGADPQGQYWLRGQVPTSGHPLRMWVGVRKGGNPPMTPPNGMVI